MDRDQRRGYLELETAAPRFESPLRLLADAFRLYWSRFGFIAGITLLIYLPGHLLYQASAAALTIPSSGVASNLLLNLLDLILSSLAIPAIVYGLLRQPDISQSLRWGRRLWLRTLGMQVLVDITVVLYAALLIVPGLIAMVRLALVPVIVAIEADRQPRPFERSRELARGRMWRMVGALLPLSLVDAAANFLLLGRISGVDNARILFVAAESGLAIVSQITLVATLLIYLGVVEPPQKKTAKL
jgi:hypothetical protein